MFSLLLSTMFICPPPCAMADEYYRSFETPRFTLYIETSSDEPLNDTRVETIATKAIAALNRNFEEFTRIFGAEVKNKVILKFLTPEEFHLQTGAPEWTSAMYYQGEITVPIPERVNFVQLRRALRHELLHFITSELSGSRCPAWLDEGMAQLIEGGAPNPLLGPALRNWLAQDVALPLSALRHGFTMLPDTVVPAAYAQSLFATRTLVNTKGFPKITEYLVHLGNGLSNEAAFEKAFDMSLDEFEEQLAPQLTRWARSELVHP